MFYQDATLRNSHVIPHLFEIILQFHKIRPFPSLRPRTSLPLIRPWILPWGVLSKMAHITMNMSLLTFHLQLNSIKVLTLYCSCKRSNHDPCFLLYSQCITLVPPATLFYLKFVYDYDCN